ncbi:hypothetical protein [Streptomyces sp. NBC_01465]|uniref:hypothetical protein n=1 Tax=Streptomyces sp. NBC_01465 TaxID=2903878 RepID=UPI002E356926|nr:hypothetical protein [Streptomyces sp. NBC_01465]
MARPLGPPKGRTAAANTFAMWLRTIIGDKTGADLEERFHYKSSAWSDYRQGRTLISEELLRTLVETYVSGPGEQAEELATGKRLLDAAREAAQLLDAPPGQRSAPPAGRSEGRVDLVDALVRLDNARQLQIDAIQKLADSERTRDHFERIAAALQERCDLLEAELKTVRIQAREEARTELRRELDLSVEYRRQADEKLAQARRTEEHARTLQATATQNVTRERIVLREAEQDEASETEEELPAPVVSIAEELGLLPLDLIPDLMRVGQERLDDQDQELAALDEKIGLSTTEGDDGHESEESGGTVLQGEVARDSSSASAPATKEQGDVHADAADQPDPGVVRGEQPENPENSVTSNDPASGSPDNDDGTTGEPADLRQDEILLGLLADAITWTLFGEALRHLHTRAGTEAPSLTILAAVVRGDGNEGGTTTMLEQRVESWLKGEPMYSHHLSRLVRSMGASNLEAEAFLLARERIVAAENEQTQHPQPANISGLRRKTAWTIALVTSLLMGGPTAAWTAGVQAHPGISVWQLILYAIGTLVAFCLVGFLGVGMIITALGVEGSAAEDAPATFILIVGLLAGLAGLVAPWVIGTDVLGHWLADQVGLLPAPSGKHG